MVTTPDTVCPAVGEEIVTVGGVVSAGGSVVETTPAVAIIGTGFSGLGMAIALKKAGRDDFVILEKAGDDKQKDNGKRLFIEKGCLACHSHAGTEPQVTGEGNFAPSTDGEKSNFFSPQPQTGRSL